MNPSVMSGLSDTFSAFRDFGLNTAGSFIGAGLSAKAASKAWARQQTMMQNRIQWMREDAEKAGINPIHLVGGMGGSSGSAPSMNPSPGPRAVAQNTGTARALANQQGKLLQAQHDAANANATASLASARRHVAAAKHDEALLPVSKLEGSLSEDPHIQDQRWWERVLGPLLGGGAALLGRGAKAARGAAPIVAATAKGSATEGYGAVLRTILNQGKSLFSKGKKAVTSKDYPGKRKPTENPTAKDRALSDYRHRAPKSEKQKRRARDLRGTPIPDKEIPF